MLESNAHACSSPTPLRPSSRNGKYHLQVCVSSGRQAFGVVNGMREQNGVTVCANGQCTFSVYAGGFDGFWSTATRGGHGDGLTLAGKLIWPFSTCCTC